MGTCLGQIEEQKQSIGGSELFAGGRSRYNGKNFSLESQTGLRGNDGGLEFSGPTILRSQAPHHARYGYKIFLAESRTFDRAEERFFLRAEARNARTRLFQRKTSHYTRSPIMPVINRKRRAVSWTKGFTLTKSI